MHQMRELFKTAMEIVTAPARDHLERRRIVVAGSNLCHGLPNIPPKFPLHTVIHDLRVLNDAIEIKFRILTREHNPLPFLMREFATRLAHCMRLTLCDDIVTQVNLAFDPHSFPSRVVRCDHLRLLKRNRTENYSDDGQAELGGSS